MLFFTKNFTQKNIYICYLFIIHNLLKNYLILQANGTSILTSDDKARSAPLPNFKKCAYLEL